MSKRKKSAQIEPPRLRFREYNRIDMSGKPDGEGLDTIAHIEEHQLGFGFNRKGKIVGWYGRERCSLTLAESVEFRMSMTEISVLMDCYAQDEYNGNDKWHNLIRAALTAHPASV